MIDERFMKLKAVDVIYVMLCHFQAFLAKFQQCHEFFIVFVRKLYGTNFDGEIFLLFSRKKFPEPTLKSGLVIID